MGKDGPGLYCLYKGDGHKNVEESEVDAMLLNGWHDNPTDALADMANAAAAVEAPLRSLHLADPAPAAEPVEMPTTAPAADDADEPQPQAPGGGYLD